MIVENEQGAHDSLVQMVRPARFLLGWMEEKEALLMFAGRRMDTPASAEYTERFLRARDAVAARPAGMDQETLLTEAPEMLSGHISALRQSQASASFFNEGWRVALVDLRKVCAFQPAVFTEHAEERVGAVDAEDLTSIAASSLPLPSRTELPAQYDQTRQAWIISAPNPNLRIVGNWGGPLQEGVAGFGFAVSVLQSFIQVARIQGRYLLRDGYHRAYGFLSRGITRVPAFVREFGPLQDPGIPPGMLPQSVYLGERPPLLSDYLDNTVSAEAMVPASQKMIVIHGLELSPMG